MQGLVVVCLMFQEISNVDVKCVKVTGAQNMSRSPGQDTYLVGTFRRSTMQGSVVVGLIVKKIWKSHWNAKYWSRSPG